MYSELVMEHFANPRNVGVIGDADGVGKVGNPLCGDVMEMFIKVEDNRIKDVKFRTFGCGAAIATSSIATEMIKGKPLDEAVQLSNKAVADALGGLPVQKMHCSNLAADAVRSAIEDYWSRQGEKDNTEDD
jgi:nitrogen fixation NifU-like protein